MSYECPICRHPYFTAAEADVCASKGTPESPLGVGDELFLPYFGGFRTRVEELSYSDINHVPGVVFRHNGERQVFDAASAIRYRPPPVEVIKP